MAGANVSWRSHVLRLIACSIAAAPISVSATPERAIADQTAIIQAVLNDARARWQGVVPCISDRLRAFGEDRNVSERISRTADLRSPFKICPSMHPSVISGDRFLTIAQPKISGNSAIVSFEYSCPVCGHGELYTVRKVKGRWGVVGRQMSWVS
jgi:hypothetical protein